MKTTIDLPDNLVRQLKLRAARDGRKLKDLAAELLRRGLSEPVTPKRLSQPVVVTDELTGLPVVQCGKMPPGAKQLSAEDIKDILLEQEIEWALPKGPRDST